MAKKRKQQKPNAEYELPVVAFKASTKKMLGIDPGSRNQGIALAACNPSSQVTIIANSIFTSPLNTLVDFMTARNTFLSEFDRWIVAYQPHGIIMERFQSRGGLAGPLIEIVSVMLGLIAGTYPQLPIMFTTAANWKVPLQRRFDFKLDDVYPICKAQPHQLDSSFIAVRGLELGLSKELTFTPDSIVEACERTSLVRLINRKVRV